MPSLARWVWFPIGAVARFVGRNARRVAVTIAGFALVGVGTALLVLPGPGVVLIAAGMALLATEYVWAQRALNYARQRAVQAKDRALNRGRRNASGGD